jgi:hypothetical protein
MISNERSAPNAVWEKKVKSELFPSKQRTISSFILAMMVVATLLFAGDSGTISGSLLCQQTSEKRAGSDAEIQIAPEALPGDPIESFKSAYGIPSVESGDTSIWQMKGMSITAYKKRDGTIARVAFHVEKGITARTPDGIVLGKDTFRDVIERARRDHLQIHERIESGDGIWSLKVYFVSKVRPEDVSVYLWFLPGNDLVDGQIDRGTLPLHSDKFLSIVVRDYTTEMKTVSEFERIEGGSSSVHD